MQPDSSYSGIQGPSDNKEAQPDTQLDIEETEVIRSIPHRQIQPSSDETAAMAETRYETMPFTGPGWLPLFGETGSSSYTRQHLSHAADYSDYHELMDQQMYSQRPQMSPPMGPPPQSPWPPSAGIPSYPSSALSSAVFPPSPYTSYQWPNTPASTETSQSFGPISPPLPIFDPAESFASTVASSFQPPSFMVRDSMTAPPGSMSPPSPEPLSSRSCSPISLADVAKPRRRSVGPIRTSEQRRTEKRRKRSSPSLGRDTSRPARDGPMSERQKEKADMVRDLGACWRCRRYKKSCDGPGKCTNCEKGNFRVWPNSLGCQRGCLEDLVAHILPAQAADVLGPASRMVLRQPNWRFGVVDMEQRRMIQERLPLCNRWERLDLKVQSTGLFGPEFSGLLDILVKHQEAQSRPNALLEASILLVDSTCDIYQNFVASAWPLPPAEITGAIASAQRAFGNVCKTFLTSALSGRGRDWLPSYLSMCMAFVAIMIMLDAAVAVPHHAQESLWGSVHTISRDLRTRVFPTITDLLRASTNGTKPFALGCWIMTSPTPSSIDREIVRNAEGMRLVGGDKAAFDGMHRLQDWMRRNIGLAELGDKVLKSDPFTTPEIPCISTVLRLFDL